MALSPSGMRQPPLPAVKTPVLALLPDPLSDNDDVTKRLSAVKNQFVSVRPIPGADAQFSSDALPVVVKAIEAYLQSLAACGELSRNRNPPLSLRVGRVGTFKIPHNA